MSLRKLGANKRWPFLMVVAMFLSGISPSFVQPTVSAQVVQGAQGDGGGRGRPGDGVSQETSSGKCARGARRHARL